MTRKNSWLIGLLVLALCFTSCGRTVVAKAEELSGNYKRTATETGAVTEAFREAFSSFSFRLLAESLNAGTGGNKLLSPLSAYVCLGLIANGAEGETKQEMEKALGLSVDDLNLALYAYTDGLSNEKDSKLELANSVWFRNSNAALKVRESFLQTLADWYQAEAFGAPFDETTRQDLDSWVSKHTDGMIQKMLDKPIDPNTMMYLVNALVFDAKWEVLYEKEQVRDWEFTGASGAKKTVKGLFSTESIYFEAAGVKGFAKPYKNENYYFVGLISAGGRKSASDLAGSLTGKQWLSMWENRSYERVKTMIPEFKTEDRTELNDVLESLGMVKMFSDSAEFLPMASYNGESLYVSEVVQKTFLELDRNGTKAAAVTWGAMNTKSAAPMVTKEVYLDRPFVYMIVDGKSGLPVMLGVIESL